jgi:hypothetical protein
LGGFPLSEGHEVDLAFAHDLDLEPCGERIHALGADAVETSRVFVGSLAKLAASVEVCQDQFQGRDLEFRMDFDRNASPVVTDRD